MTRDFDVRTRTAALVRVAQYGSDAELVAVMRAAEYTAAGDAEGLAAWDEMLGRLADLEAEGSAARTIPSLEAGSVASR